MIMNPGMLLFGLFDSALAFYLVYSVSVAKFGGAKKTRARTVGSILGMIVFIAMFATIVWFNTATKTVSDAVKMTVYLAPIVLTILMTILVLLSQPPKKEEEEEKKEGEDGDETATQEN